MQAAISCGDSDSEGGAVCHPVCARRADHHGGKKTQAGCACTGLLPLNALELMCRHCCFCLVKQVKAVPRCAKHNCIVRTSLYRQAHTDIAWAVTEVLYSAVYLVPTLCMAWQQAIMVFKGRLAFSDELSSLRTCFMCPFCFCLTVGQGD